MPYRYEGKPMLLLLECYVLSAIGQLQENDERRLEEMTPKLCEVYNTQGSWREIIAQVMRFPPEADEQFRTMWQHNRQLAAQNDEELLAEDFARMIVDDNFS